MCEIFTNVASVSWERDMIDDIQSTRWVTTIILGDKVTVNKTAVIQT